MCRGECRGSLPFVAIYLRRTPAIRRRDSEGGERVGADRARSPIPPPRANQLRMGRRDATIAAPGAAAHGDRVLEEVRVTKPNETPRAVNGPPLAYFDHEFLDSDEGRPLRILS